MPAEPVRVRDNTTGHEYTTRHVTENHTVLDERAVDANGRHLPAKTADTPKSSGAKKASAKTKTDGEPVVNPEEGSS